MGQRAAKYLICTKNWGNVVYAGICPPRRRISQNRGGSRERRWSTQGTTSVSDRNKHVGKIRKIPDLFDFVKYNLKEAFENSKKAYNLRPRRVDHQVGQIVWCKTHHQWDAAFYFSNKLTAKCVCGYLRVCVRFYVCNRDRRTDIDREPDY